MLLLGDQLVLVVVLVGELEPEGLGGRDDGEGFVDLVEFLCLKLLGGLGRDAGLRHAEGEDVLGSGGFYLEVVRYLLMVLLGEGH